MDSANSTGSMQSSSTGADEEYDSRADSSSSLSAFFNHNNHHPPPPQQPPQPPPPTTNHVGLFNPRPNTAHHVFDPFSSYLDSIQTSPNLAEVWGRSSSSAVRSEPNQTDLVNNNPFLLNQFTTSGAAAAVLVPNSQQQLSIAAENASINDHQAQSNNSNNNNNNNPVRNPKKRSRASRRAPTTVLTTDTTNFRAMVQEFTGIPAPPFSSSHFPRTRLDLFGNSANAAASSTPPYLLRPFAQKLQPQQHQQQQQQQQQHQHQQLPLNTFQSIVQQAPAQKYSIGNSSLMVSPKTQSTLEIPPATVVDSHLKMGVIEGLGLISHAHVNTQISSLHQNMVPSSSDGALLSRINNIHNSSGNWAQRMGANNAINANNDHHGGGVLGSLIGRSSNIIPEGLPNGGGPSDFQGEKGPDHRSAAAAARSEGTVESWIYCSSE